MQYQNWAIYGDRSGQVCVKSTSECKKMSDLLHTNMNVEHVNYFTSSMRDSTVFSGV